MWRLGVDTHGQTQDHTTNYFYFPHVSVKSVKSHIETDTVKNEKSDTRCAYSKKIVRIIFLRITLEEMFAMLSD